MGTQTDPTLYAPAEEGEVRDRVTLKLHPNQLALFRVRGGRPRA